ncbi:carboxypeptidase regulatory-like domain-containing protein [Candidatus Hydrogenedentota bacterium]
MSKPWSVYVCALIACLVVSLPATAQTIDGTFFSLEDADPLVSSGTFSVNELMLYPIWSNKGDKIAFLVWDIKGTRQDFDDDTVNVYVMGLDVADTPVKLTWDAEDAASDNVSPRGSLAWSPDDSHVAFSAVEEGDDLLDPPKRIKFAPVDSDTETHGTAEDDEKTIAPDGDAGEVGVYDPAYTRIGPGNEYFLVYTTEFYWFTTFPFESGNYAELLVQEVSSSGLKTTAAPVQITEFWKNEGKDFKRTEFPRWDSDGEKIVFCHTRVSNGFRSDVYVLSDVQDIVAGSSEPPTSLGDIRIKAITDATGDPYSTQPAFSEDGQYVYYTRDISGTFVPEEFSFEDTNFLVHVANSNGENTPVKLETDFQAGWLSSSTGGTRVAFVNDSANAGTSRIYVTSVELGREVAKSGRAVAVSLKDGSGFKLTLPASVTVTYGETLPSPNGLESIVAKTPLTVPGSTTWLDENSPLVNSRLLSPGNMSFSGNATLTYSYTDEELGGQDESKLFVYRLNSATGKYDIPLPVAERLPDENKIVVYLKSFGPLDSAATKSGTIRQASSGGGSSSGFGLGSSIATAAISGAVTSEETGDAIPGATVSLDFANSYTTDSNGAYVFVALPGGTYSISAGASGYKTSSAILSVANGEVAVLDMALTPGQDDGTGPVCWTSEAAGKNAGLLQELRETNFGFRAAMVRIYYGNTHTDLGR